MYSNVFTFYFTENNFEMEMIGHIVTKVGLTERVTDRASVGEYVCQDSYSTTDTYIFLVYIQIVWDNENIDF